MLHSQILFHDHDHRQIENLRFFIIGLDARSSYAGLSEVTTWCHPTLDILPIHNGSICTFTARKLSSADSLSALGGARLPPSILQGFPQNQLPVPLRIRANGGQDVL